MGWMNSQLGQPPDRKLTLSLLLIPALMIGVRIPVSAQVEVEAAPSAVFRDSIDVELVNIDVFVTDRDGNPVTNLSATDFEVFEDGEPVRISHFAIVDSPGTATRGVGSTLEGSPGAPNAQRPPSSAADDGMSPHLIVAFDSRNLTHTAQRRMMKGMREFIVGTSIPHDRVMIVNLGSGGSSGFEVAVPFGSTLEDLQSGLDRADKLKPAGRLAANEYQHLLRRLTQTHMEFRERAAQPGGNVSEAQICEMVKLPWQADIRAYAEQTAMRVLDTVQMLTYLMENLAGVPGHKSFLYVGGGLEMVPGEDVYAYANNICPGLFNLIDSQGFSRTAVMKQLTDAANAHRISFNAYEAAASRISMIVSAEYKNAQYTPGAVVEDLRTANLQSSLVMLASETGGTAILNTEGRFPDFETVENALFSFYSLGYAPPQSGRKKAHDVKVKLKEPAGLKLRYRRGYSERPQGRQLQAKLMSALTLGWSDNPLDVSLGHGEVEPIPGKHDSFLVPISVTVPLGGLVCIQEQTGDSRCQVGLLMCVIDEKEKVSPLYQKSLSVRLKNDSTPPDDVTFTLNNTLRSGNHRVVVGVVDNTSSTTSYVSLPVTVGSS